MKKIILPIIVLVLTLSQVTAQVKFRSIERNLYKVEPGFKPEFLKPSSQSLAARAGDTTCSTYLLNMPYNYMLWGSLQGFNLSGNWYQTSPEVLVERIVTNKVPGNDNLNYNITMIYDTMITNVYAKNSFFKLSKPKSTIRLDSLTIFGAIQVADTSVLTGLANDTFVISTYLTNNGAIGTKLFDSFYTVANGGIKKFLFQGGFVGSRRIKYSHQFNKGETFAIRLEYRTTKVDTGFVICYGYVDSCNTLVFNGNNISSPAVFPAIYPGCVQANTVDSLTPSTASTRLQTNQYAYTGLGFPANCSYIYPQMYYVIPQIFVCEELNGTIALGKSTYCDKDVVTAYGLASGGKAPYTYSWTTTAGTVIGSSTLDSFSFTLSNPSGTINLTITDAASNTVVLTKSMSSAGSFAFSYTLLPNRTKLDACGDSVKVTGSQSTSAADYLWSTGATTNFIYVKTAGTVRVTVTSKANGCKVDTAITFTLSGTSSAPTLDFSYTPDPACGGSDVTLTVASSATKTGWTYNWKDGATLLGSGTSLTYKPTATKLVTLTADSGSCGATPFSKSVNLISPPTLNFTPTSACINTFVTFKVTGKKAGWDYSWDGNSTTANGDTFRTKFTASGKSDVILKADSAGCAAVDKKIAVTINAVGAGGCKASIAATDLHDQITIFPNPVKEGILNVKNESLSAISVKVTDILGKTVSTDKMNGSRTASLDLSNVSNGVYFVEIESKNDRIVKKIVVDKQ